MYDLKNEDLFILVKEAYKKLYLKSRNYELSDSQKDAVLDLIVDEKLEEIISKLIEEGYTFSDSEKNELISKIKEMMGDWKEELKTNNFLNK